MDKKTEKIIVNFLMNTSNIEELEVLTEWLKKQENKQVFKDYVKTNYAMDINMKQFDVENAKKEYLRKIKQDKSVFYKYRLYSVFKYAAIAVLFLGIGYFYQQGFFSNNDKNATSAEENITLQLDNGNIEVINEDGFRKIVNAQGTVVGTQKGTQLIYKGADNIETLVYNTLTVPYGKRSKVHLSDGTVVNLNAGTSLRFPVKFIEGENRKVFVEGGEAYFNVVKDAKHPFIVNSDEIDIRVLGTQFNVSSYPEDANISTVLVEGSVSIYDKDKLYRPEDATLLDPGFKADWNKGKNEIIIEEADIEMHTAWINGRVIFRHVPFNNIVKKLERHYNVEIINNDKALGKDLITASFDIETIEQVFKVINEIHPINYTIKDRKIIIN